MQSDHTLCTDTCKVTTLCAQIHAKWPHFVHRYMQSDHTLCADTCIVTTLCAQIHAKWPHFVRRYMQSDHIFWSQVFLHLLPPMTTSHYVLSVLISHDALYCFECARISLWSSRTRLVRIQTRKSSILVGDIYRNLTPKFDWYGQFVTIMYSKLNIVLLGDFNTDMQRTNPAWDSTWSYLA